MKSKYRFLFFDVDHFAEVEEPLELGAVAMLPKTRMIAILLPPTAIPRSDLKVSVLVRTDPHLCPRRWDHQ